MTDDGDATARGTRTGERPDDTAERDGADVAAVKAALERLARDDERPDPRRDPAAVVAAAADATARLDETVAFLRADGRQRLRVAVRRLRAADRSVTADRGAAVLDALAAAERATEGHDSPRRDE